MPTFLPAFIRDVKGPPGISPDLKTQQKSRFSADFWTFWYFLGLQAGASDGTRTRDLLRDRQAL